MNPSPKLPLSDRALQTGEPDLLGRGAFVRNLATILCNAPKGDSVVFALYGKWGEGKTSTLTLLEQEFKVRKENSAAVPVVIRFNPWVFSGREHLFNAFFEDIGNAIGSSGVPDAADKAKKWKRLGAYSNLLGEGLDHIDTVLNLLGASVPGGTILRKLLGSVSKVTDTAAAAEDAAPAQNLSKIRGDLEAELAEMRQPLLVVLDDLDRLPPPELVEIFQLLKSTVDLPNVHYLLLCDRGNIEENLHQQGFRPDYLEKIIQFSAPLPAIPDALLHRLLISQLQTIFTEVAPNDSRLDHGFWARMRESSWLHAFSTLRDVKRFVGEVRIILPVFCPARYFELNPEHFLTLQALRLFCPSVVELVRNKRRLFLTKHHGFFKTTEVEQITEEKAKFIQGEIPETLKSWEASRYLPLVNELLEPYGANISNSALATEQRHFTSPLWFDAYFTLEMPQKVVSVAEAGELRRKLDGDLKDLTEFVAQVLSRSGEMALYRYLATQTSEEVHDHGQALICALLSAEGSGSDDDFNAESLHFTFETYFERWLRFTPAEESERKVLEILQKTRNHRFFADCLSALQRKNAVSSEIFRNLFPFRAALGKATAGIIVEKSAKGDSLLNDNFRLAQKVWVNWASKSKLKKWIREVTKTDSGLHSYLLALGWYEKTDEGGDEVEHFRLHHHNLAFFPDIREGIRRCAVLLASAESHRDRSLWKSSIESFKDQLPYRKGFQFFKAKHPGILKARFHPAHLEVFNSDSMAIITAENPDGVRQTPEENLRLTELLAEDLQKREISATKFAVGAEDGSHREQSFLIAVTEKVAVEIGRKYGQVAIFMVYGKQVVEIVACGGEGKHHLGLLSQIVV